MQKFTLSLPTRLAAMLMLAVYALPLAAVPPPDDCYSYCNDVSLTVLEATGNRGTAKQVYNECVEEQCPK